MFSRRQMPSRLIFPLCFNNKHLSVPGTISKFTGGTKLGSLNGEEDMDSPPGW